MVNAEQNTTIDGRTRRGADLALAKRLISRASYGAVLAGELTLQHAKEYGRDGGPDDPAAPGAVQDVPATAAPWGRRRGRERPYLCCGDATKGGRFLPGHDARLFGELKRNLEKDPLLKNERFTDEQREYARERG
ncbi:MAG: hypothetical protein M3Q49_10020, partial [Actinomycetota bacterium]|nr:hypothetical protein [Actinomycetota bacterium]